MTTAKNWQRSAMAFAIGLGCAILGFMAAPEPAAAASKPAMHWGCGAGDSCGPGSSECCEMVAGHCSSTCPIIIN